MTVEININDEALHPEGFMDVLLDVLSELKNLATQGGPKELASWCEWASKWLKKLLSIIVLLPMCLIFCMSILGIWEPDVLWNPITQKVEKTIFQLLVIALAIYVIRKLINPLTVSVLSIPIARRIVVKIIAAIAVGLLVDALIGIYLTAPPGLNLPLVIAVGILLLVFLRLLKADGQKAVGAGSPSNPPKSKGWTKSILLAVAIIAALLCFHSWNQIVSSIQDRHFSRQESRPPGNSMSPGAALSTPPAPTTPQFIYNPDQFFGPDGHRTTFEHSAFPYSRYQDNFPVGYWVLEDGPTLWNARWRALPAHGKPCTWYYLKPIPRDQPDRDVAPIGPLNWCDQNPEHHTHTDNTAFWIQAVNSDEDIVFTSTNPNIPDESAFVPTAITRSALAAGATITPPNLHGTPEVPCTDEIRRMNFSGSATVTFSVTFRGDTENVMLVKSTGIPKLDEKVIETVENYKFDPATRDNLPVPFPAATVDVRVEPNCHE